uniref:Tubulin-tyrosine ligase family protein n=1 Tax=viral metagenome TaxID=1070528 RepID=A0A6C0I111_9ZZZZ
MLYILYFIFFYYNINMMIILLFILLILIALIIAIIILSTNANAIIGGKKKYTIQTYKLFSDDNGKFCEYLRHKLNLLGWKEADNNAKYVDFAYRPYHKKLLTDKNISKKYKHIHANLKSTLNNFDKLGNKQKLATIMKHSSYIAQTEAIKDYHWKDEDIIIVREIDSQKQKGVYIVIDRPNFIQLRDMLLTEKRDAIVSKYITNPLLYKGKKFHLRMYITIFIDKNGNKKIKYMPNYIKIITAKKQYVIRDKIDYLDPEMNISGTGIGTNIIIFWDIDQCHHLSESSVIFFNKCNKSIYAAIDSIPLDSILLFPEQSAGFYTYGGDIMLDDTGHAWILELNTYPGCLVSEWWSSTHNKFNKTFIDYLSKVYDFLLDEFILPYFGYR